MILPLIRSAPNALRRAAVTSGIFLLFGLAGDLEAQQVAPQVAQQVEVEADELAAPAATLDDEAELQRYLVLFAEVLARVKQHHYDDPPVRDLIEGAIRGMLDTLDPYSQYYDEQAYKNLQTDTRGKFGGLGISFGVKDNRLTVIAALEDTPAFRADIQAGDVISAIDDESTMSMSTSEAVRRMRGEPGTDVTLTVLREGLYEPIVQTITRDIITVVSVKYHLLQDNVGYIRVTGFMEPTAQAVGEALEALVQENVEGFILDLRSNPGGLLSSAVDVASYFLNEGDLVVETQGGEEKERLLATAKDLRTDLPLVVLVNVGSASASEIVAGALRAHRRALLLGVQSFGKASVQKIYPLEEGTDSSALRLTIAHYYTPDGIDIHEVGIEPDVELAGLGPLEARMWRRVRTSEALEAFLDDEEDDVLERLDALDRKDTSSPLRRKYSALIDELEADDVVLRDGLIKYAIAFETLSDEDEYRYDPQIRTAVQYLKAFDTFRRLSVAARPDAPAIAPATPDGVED